MECFHKNYNEIVRPVKVNDRFIVMKPNEFDKSGITFYTICSFFTKVGFFRLRGEFGLHAFNATEANKANGAAVC